MRYSPSCTCCCLIWEYENTPADKLQKFADGVNWFGLPGHETFDSRLDPGERYEVIKKIPATPHRVVLDLAGPPTDNEISATNSNEFSGSLIQSPAVISGVTGTVNLLKVDLDWTPAGGANNTQGFLFTPDGGNTQLWSFGSLPSTTDRRQDAYEIQPPVGLVPNGTYTLQINGTPSDVLHEWTITVVEEGQVDPIQREPFSFTMKGTFDGGNNGWFIRQTRIPQVRSCADSIDYNSETYDPYFTSIRYIMLSDVLGYIDRNYTTVDYFEGESYYRWKYEDGAYFKSGDPIPYAWDGMDMRPIVYSTRVDLRAWETAVASIAYDAANREYDQNNWFMPFTLRYPYIDQELTVELLNDDYNSFFATFHGAEKIPGINPADLWDCTSGSSPLGTQPNASCDPYPPPCPLLGELRHYLSTPDQPSHPSMELSVPFEGNRKACAAAIGTWCGSISGAVPNPDLPQPLLIADDASVGSVVFNLSIDVLPEDVRTEAQLCPNTDFTYDRITTDNTTVYDFSDNDIGTKKILYSGSVSAEFPYTFNYSLVRIQNTDRALLSAEMTIYYFGDGDVLVRTENPDGGPVAPPPPSSAYVCDEFDEFGTVQTDDQYKQEIFLDFIGMTPATISWDPVEIDLCDWVPGFSYLFEFPDNSSIINAIVNYEVTQTNSSLVRDTGTQTHTHQLDQLSQCTPPEPDTEVEFDTCVSGDVFAIIDAELAPASPIDLNQISVLITLTDPNP